MEIDRLTAMGIDSVRAQSLADATPVLTLLNGMPRTRLQNERTGEFLISFCSAHLSYNYDCPRCHLGVWKHLP